MKKIPINVSRRIVYTTFFMSVLIIILLFTSPEKEFEILRMRFKGFVDGIMDIGNGIIQNIKREYMRLRVVSILKKIIS